MHFSNSHFIEYCEAIPIAIPRDVPYLGPLEAGIPVNERGYFVRPGNRSIYSTSDCSVLVKAVCTDGTVGWGECVTVVAPGTVAEILNDLVFPLVIGKDAFHGPSIYADLYDAMRVRGFFGGHYHDALAAMDIALWDLRGKLIGLPVSELLGGARRTRIPAYVSGLPRKTQADRVKLAAEWISKGFDALKLAAAVVPEGELSEMQALRRVLGHAPRILIDFHWRYTAAEAIQIISRLEPLDLYVAEAPVAPEDMEGQAQVAASVHTPVAIGEELRTVYEYVPRFLRRSMDVIQPEMGRTGLTSFVDICKLSQAFHCRVMPHASIGIGVFLAASLHVSATLQNCPLHEYQPSIFDNNLRFVTGNMSCSDGSYTLPAGPGLGVEPNEDALAYRLDKQPETVHG